jgi:hypothetical protein
MAYTIVKSDGQVLTTIADGTINTSATSLALPGRNYAGYGQSLDTNFVHVLENFADGTPPSNPIRGQLWYNTNANTLYVCPTDGASASSWLALSSTASGGTTTFGNVSISGNLTISGDLATTGNISGANGTFTNFTITANATIANAAVTTGNIGTVNTANITTGANTTAGSLTGNWTLNGQIVSGNSKPNAIYTDNYYYANGAAFTPAGTYTNANVAAYLPTYNGGVLASYIQTANITTGGNTTAGTLTGNWTLTTGSRLQATYADLAERFAADDVYDAGTVVELGGDKEITAVQYELSEDVFGVVSDTAAYLMNAGAGSDETHPPIAVSGRVHVKVIGQVKKGQRLVSAGNGIARAANDGEATAFNTIGRSLVDKTTDDVGTVLAMVTIK